MAKLVLTAVGDDRPGLVSALSAAVVEAGGNWLSSEMARLAGKFAGIALVEVPDAETLRRCLAPLMRDGLLEVSMIPADNEGSAFSGTQLHVSVLGHDRPGIVREVSGSLASLGVWIDRLETTTRSVPMGGGVLFEADMDVRVPDAVREESVREALESLSSDLVVDLESLEEAVS